MSLNIFKFFFLLICLSFFGRTNAQNVKPKFKKFLYVAYRPVGTGKKESIRMENYLEIDGNGILHYICNNYTGSYYTNLTYNGSMSDTTYRIPDSLIADLNTIFNGSEKLKDHMITDKSSGQFAGPLEFITYTADNNTTDNFIIVKGYLDRELNDLLEKVWRLPFSKTIQKGKVYRNSTVEAQILKYQKACKYVPEIIAPPTVRFLDK